MDHWLSAGILLGTLVVIITRPRGISEAAGASIGAACTLLLRLASLADLWQILRETANVLLFLLGMMIVTGIAEHAGVFDALAERAARAARGSGHLLLLNVFALGALITALLSLDVTIIVLTPVIFVVVDRLGIDPLPYLFACAFVANTASLFLPISNLTNILIYDLLHLSFRHFATVMFLPNLAALLVNIAVFFALFRHQIPRRFTMHLPPTVRSRGFFIATIALTLVLAALLAFGLAGLPLAVPALAGAVTLGAWALIGRNVTPVFVRDSVTWSLFPFVIAMFVIIRGVEHAWLAAIPPIPTDTGLGTLTAIAFGTGIGANIVNNIPMAVGMIGVLRTVAVPVPEHLAFATLIGTNIGPSVLTVGSLATMLWLAIVRRRGVAVSALAYLRVGLITTPPMVAAATIVLWLVLRVMHG